MQKLLCLLILSAIIQLVSTFECLNHRCSGEHNWCRLYRENHQEEIKSECTDHKHDDGITCDGPHSVNHDHGCFCHNYECVQKTVSAMTQSATTLQCLSHICHETEWCHLHLPDDDKRNTHKGLHITSKCTHNKNRVGITCIGLESVMTSEGCYCDTTECVHNTALHALGTVCHVDQEIDFYKEFDAYRARCRLLEQPIQNCDIFYTSDLPNLPCACKTQYCANTMMDRVHEALRTTAAPTTTTTTPTTTTSTPTTTTTTQAPVTTTIPIQIQPGMMCGDKTCDIYNIYCHLFQYNDVHIGRCMPFNVWQPCKTYTDIYHQGCTCTATSCGTNMITDFYAHTATTSGFSPTTTGVPASTATPTIAQTTIVSTTAKSTSNAPSTTGSTSNTAITHIATTATPWSCLNVACQPNEACRLSFGVGGIMAVCETGGTGVPDCVDHQSITKVGCLCRTEICVAKTALHCFGNNCPADKTCKISRAVNGSFTGNCSELDFSHLSFCSKTPANQQVHCDCWTQSCIDLYQSFTPIAHQPSTVLMSSPLTTAAPTVAVTQLTQTVRSCNKCGDKDLSIPCSNREIIMDLQSTCNTGEDYCMTDVYHDAIGQVDVYKRCVNKATCDLEWIGQSADLDYCKKYGVIKNPSAFQCHFCCVSDGCNTNKMPNSTTLFTKV